MKILYVGGFQLPDKNAAAQRVVNIAKALRDLGHEVIFLHNVKLKILFVRKIGNSLSDKKGDNPFLCNI